MSCVQGVIRVCLGAVLCLRSVFEGLHVLKDVACVWVKHVVCLGVVLYICTGSRVVMSLFLSVVCVSI